MKFHMKICSLKRPTAFQTKGSNIAPEIVRENYLFLETSTSSSRKKFNNSSAFFGKCHAMYTNKQANGFHQ